MSTAARKLTIGLPVYNEEARIGDSLRRLSEQTFRDFNIIVFDNCSTDRTREIVRECAIIDPRISLHENQENIGALGNFKACLEACETPYFKWLAADDWIAPRYVERCLEMLEARSSVVAVQTAHIIFDGRGEIKRTRLSDRSRSFGWRHLAPYAASTFKANYFIYGIFKSEILKKMYLHIEAMPGFDRWFLTGMPPEGEIEYLDEFLHYRFKNPVTFAKRHASDQLARSQEMRFLPLCRTLNRNLPHLSLGRRFCINAYFLKWYARWRFELFKRRKRRFEKRLKLQLRGAVRGFFY